MIKYVPMHKIAMMGFIWKAMKDYQIQEKRTVADVAASDPETRIKETGKIFNILENYLIRILKRSEDKNKLHDAIYNGFEFYKKNFANR